MTGNFFHANVRPTTKLATSTVQGKTYRLTVELLARAAAGSETESILATTFTRKAAGELRERFQSRVEERLGLAGFDEEERLRIRGPAPARPSSGRSAPWFPSPICS